MQNFAYIQAEFKQFWITLALCELAINPLRSKSFVTTSRRASYLIRREVICYSLMIKYDIKSKNLTKTSRTSIFISFRARWWTTLSEIHCCCCTPSIFLFLRLNWPFEWPLRASVTTRGHEWQENESFLERHSDEQIWICLWNKLHS